MAAPDASGKVIEDAATLTAAADAARESEALAEALRRLLDVGNALNEGTARGNAQGFTLASLERVAATKSTVGGGASALSVLDFAARKPLSNDGDDRLAALEPTLRAAPRPRGSFVDASRSSHLVASFGVGSTPRRRRDDLRGPFGRGRTADGIFT